jgi:hypothetical protein
MVMQFIEGFDWCSNINNLSITEYMTTNASLYTPGRFGNYCVLIDSNSALYLNINTPTPKNQLFFGYATKILGVSSSYTFLTIGNHLTCRHNSRGSLSLRRDATIIDTSIIPMNINTWLYIAMDIYIHDTSGYVTIYFNGNQVINYTGNTKNNADDTITFFRFNGITSKNYIDDIYIADNTGPTNNTIILDARIQTLLPSSDTAQSDFIPLSGSDNYAMVDEVLQDGDTSYVESSTSGAKDLYNHTSLTSNTSTVYSVSPFVIAKKTDADLVNIKPIISSNGVESYSTESLLSEYLFFNTLIDLNPDTTSSWTPSEVNNSLVGFSIESV